MLSPYGALFRIAFKNSFAYRSSVLTGILGSLFFVVAQTAIWTYVFRHDPAMIRYMTRYVIVSQIIGMLMGNNITDRIAGRVQGGDFAIDLIKPGNTIVAQWSACFGETVAGLVTRGIPVLLVFLPSFLSSEFHPERLPLFLAVLALSVVLATLLFVLLAYLSFIVLEVWPFKRLLNDTIRLLAGAVIPLAFFPPFLQRIADALPFQYLYSLPIRVLLDGVTPAELARSAVVLSLWIVVTAFAVRMTSTFAIRRIVIQGG